MQSEADNQLDEKPVKINSIKIEVKQEYDPDAYPTSDENLEVRPFPVDIKQLKPEPDNLEDENEQDYFISGKDLKELGAIKNENIDLNPDQIPIAKRQRRKSDKLCKYCNIQCENSKKLWQHMKRHTDERRFQCALCNSAFKEKYHLTVHIKTHRGERNIPCTLCDKSFIVQSALKAHMRTHSKEKPYVCSICGKGFSHSANLKPHIATHAEGLPFKCEECGERVRDRKGLLRHMRSHHIDCKIEGCDFCSKFNKDAERSSKILDGKVRKCAFCLETFKYYPAYKSHLRTHNTENYPCSVCNKTYMNIAYLRMHMRNHTGETPYECNVCGKKFKRKDSFKYHVSTHNEERRLFNCDVCNKGFTHRSSLFKHQRQMHDIEEPFADEKTFVQCKICSQNVDVRGYTIHMKKHGVRLFKCRRCRSSIEGREKFEAHKKSKCLLYENIIGKTSATNELENDEIEEKKVKKEPENKVEDS